MLGKITYKHCMVNDYLQYIHKYVHKSRRKASYECIVKGYKNILLILLKNREVTVCMYGNSELDLQQKFRQPLKLAQWQKFRKSNILSKKICMYLYIIDLTKFLSVKVNFDNSPTTVCFEI